MDLHETDQEQNRSYFSRFLLWIEEHLTAVFIAMILLLCTVSTAGWVYAVNVAKHHTEELCSYAKINRESIIVAATIPTQLLVDISIQNGKDRGDPPEIIKRNKELGQTLTDNVRNQLRITLPPVDCEQFQ